MGAAPGHGTRYHAFGDRTKDNSWNDSRAKWDRFANFDANGTTGKALSKFAREYLPLVCSLLWLTLFKVESLAKAGIAYTFLQIYPFTVKMTNALGEYYNAVSPVRMNVIELTSVDKVPTAINEAIAKSVERTRNN